MGIIDKIAIIYFSFFTIRTSYYSSYFLNLTLIGISGGVWWDEKVISES